MAPRFTINRATGEVTCHKPIAGQDLFRVQRAILIKQIELHPEVFNEDADLENLCAQKGRQI